MEPLTDAQQKLVEQNLWLVGCITKAIHAKLPASVEWDDVEQAGCLGLIDAAIRFDQSLGASFVTFARWRVNGAIRDYLRSLDFVSKEERSRITAGEACEQVQMRVDDLYAQPRDTAASPEELSMAAQITAQIGTLMESLNGRQRTILREYYFQDRTMSQIGKGMGVKEARISQVHKKTIEQLRQEPGFLSRKSVFRFAMNSGLLTLFVLALSFAPAADAQTPLDATGRGCRGNAVQVVLTVPLAAGAITVPVPVCATLGPGLTLNTAVNPPRLEAAPVAMPRAVIERFPLPPDLPASQTTASFTLKNTPTGAILGGFRSSRIGGEVVDFLKAGGDKLLTIKVPSYRPFTADDELAVLYWTLEAE